MKIRTLLALALASALLLIAGPAVNASAYPVTTCATLSVSTTTPLEGESITISGSNFTAGAHVRLELQADKVYVLANVTASAQGTFSTSVKLPAGVVGSHPVLAVGGGATADCSVDPIQILKPGGNGGQPSNPAGGGGGTNGGGGTAFTGVDVALLVIIAALLVVAGVMLNRGGKRRRVLYPNEIG